MSLKQKVKIFLGLDLLGRLKYQNNRYRKNQIYIFDSKNIICGVTEWSSPKRSFSVWASAFCDDPMVNGLDLSNNFIFWQVYEFDSEKEAASYLEREIQHTARVFPETRFNFVCNGELQKCYLDGTWQDCNSIPNNPCPGCGCRENNPGSVICSECGELLIF